MYNNYFGNLGAQYPTNSYNPNFQQKVQNVNYASEEEINAYILQPNAQIMAIDREKQVFYIKTADALGRSTVSKYKFEEIQNNVEKVEYLTKKDFEEFLNQNQFASKEDITQLRALIGKVVTSGKND